MAKKEKKKITKTQFQWKIVKRVFIAYLVVFIIMGLIQGAMKEEKTIEEKIGSYEPIGIPLKEALYIKSYSIMPYVDYIKSGDYDSAYDMLTKEYRDMVSKEEYLQKIEGINWDTFDMQEIHMKAQDTYVASIKYEQNGEEKETEYLLFVNAYNSKIVEISPDKFIYQYRDLIFNEDKVEVKVAECDIYINTITVKMTVKNKSLMQDMSFSGVTLGYGQNINKEVNCEFTLKPGEEKEIAFTAETSYYLPNNIKIKRIMDEETMRTYTFYFQKEE